MLSHLFYNIPKLLIWINYEYTILVRIQSVCECDYYSNTINFRQSTTILVKAMHNLQLHTSTWPEKLQAINPTVKITCKQTPRARKAGTLVWIADAVLLRKALFCFV